MKTFPVLLSCLLLLCSAGRAQTSQKPRELNQMPANLPPTVMAAPSDNATEEDQYNEMLASIASLYREAGSPVIALATSFYQLPVEEPGGACVVDNNMVHGKAYSSYKISTLSGQTYDTIDMYPRQAMVLRRTLSLLRNSGLNLLVLPKNTVTRLINSEHSAIDKSTVVNFGSVLPKSVTYLLTVQKGFVAEAPFFVGRVIRINDGGSLYALWKEPETVVYSVQPLYLGLIQEALKQIIAEKKP